MTAFEDQHSVWTAHHDERWKAKNETSDLVLVDTLSLGRARFLCERLLMIDPEGEFWIKDIYGKEVTRYSNRPSLVSAQPERPARRKLGGGARG